MGRFLSSLLAAALFCSVLAGCQSGVPAASSSEAVPSYVDEVELSVVEIEDEAVALSEAPTAPMPTLFEQMAAGTLEKRSEKAVIDYSNTKDGYVMAQYLTVTEKRLKAQVKGPTTTYTYNLTSGQWAAFPLSDGSGSYKVTVYENVVDTKYSAVLSVSFEAALTDEFAPFLHPNQYVDYSSAPNTVAKAAELMAGMEHPLDKVKAAYGYVVNGLSYDKEKAATVTSGYLPVLDSVLESKRGICFDYAALMTGMLRSQGVPCKLVVGYAGKTYHAWISVWSAESGWIDGAVYFDGSAWQRMDPTFASSGKQSKSIMAFIGDGTNYTAKYLY